MRLTRVTLSLITAILALGFYRLITYLLDDLEFQTFQATEEVMVDAAHLLAAQIESRLTSPVITPDIIATLEQTLQTAKTHQFSAKIFVKEKTRVTLDCYLTNAQGFVLYDSTNQRTGQNLSAWHDVSKTLKGQYGARSTRSEESDDTSSIMYIGAPISYKNSIIGVATVYKAQSDLLPFVKARRKQIFWPTIALAGAILFLIGSVLIWVYRPIGRLADFARRITAGERPAFPSLGKGQEVNALGTALRDMRETLEGRSYIENYTQTLTHELKSPLAAIRGAAELLDEEMPRQDRTKFLSNIRNEVDRSERLINRLLHLSALEGKTELSKRQTVDLPSLLRETARLLQSQADLKNVTLTLNLPNAAITLLGDYYILRAAIENLLQNALDFSPLHSEIRLSLTTKDEIATITITDQGPGLPPFALEKAFQRFFSHRPAHFSNKGSGLGLTFVREAAKLHHGTATLSNLPQHGAQAVITLPLTHT